MEISNKVHVQCYDSFVAPQQKFEFIVSDIIQTNMFQSKVPIVCPGEYSKLNINEHKFYSCSVIGMKNNRLSLLDGESAYNWSLCEWCYNNGCADVISNGQLHEVKWCENTIITTSYSSDDAVSNPICTPETCNRVLYNCGCKMIHGTNQMYYCNDCLYVNRSIDTRPVKTTCIASGECEHNEKKPRTCSGTLIKGIPCGVKLPQHIKHCEYCSLKLDICPCGNPHIFANVAPEDRGIVEKYFSINYGHKGTFSSKIVSLPHRTSKYISGATARTLSALDYTEGGICIGSSQTTRRFNMRTEIMKAFANAVDDNAVDAHNVLTYYTLPIAFHNTAEVCGAILRMAKLYPSYLSLIGCFSSGEIKEVLPLLIDNIGIVANKRFPFGKLFQIPELISHIIKSFVDSCPCDVSQYKHIYQLIRTIRYPTGKVSPELQIRALEELKLAILECLSQPERRHICDEIVIASCRGGKSDSVQEMAAFMSIVGDFNADELANEGLRRYLYKNEGSYWNSKLYYVALSAPNFPWNYEHLQIAITTENHSNYNYIFGYVLRSLGKSFDVMKGINMVCDHFAAKSPADEPTLELRKKKYMIEIMMEKPIWNYFLQQLPVVEFKKYMLRYKELFGELPNSLNDEWPHDLADESKICTLLEIGYVFRKRDLSRLVSSYREYRGLPDWHNEREADEVLIAKTNEYEGSGINWGIIMKLRELSKHVEEIHKESYTKFFENWNDDVREKICSVVREYNLKESPLDIEKNKRMYKKTNAIDPCANEKYNEIVRFMDLCVLRFGRE